MNSKLLVHLEGRPIAPILQASSEKDNIIALKLMCILDHKLDEMKMYKAIEKSPKLLKQLLGFKTYADFHYFQYIPPRNFDPKLILQCRYCELIGPYFVILSHMELTHGTQIGSKQCHWCKDVDLKEHVETNTVHRCNEKYLQRQRIEDGDLVSMPIIRDFYAKIISELADKLGVLTKRYCSFTGEGILKKEIWHYDGIEPEVLVHRYRRPKGIKRPGRLDGFYKNAITVFYGEYKAKEFLPQSHERRISDRRRFPSRRPNLIGN